MSTCGDTHGGPTRSIVSWRGKQRSLCEKQGMFERCSGPVQVELGTVLLLCTAVHVESEL